MSIRRRLALMICPELAPARRSFDRPCLMEAHGPGQVSAYCVRCGQNVSVALPEVCPARAPTRGKSLGGTQ